MSIQSIEVIRGSLPLVSPFVTSYGTETHRHFLLLHVVGDEGDGWGECVALAEPLYTSEYIDGADEMIRRFFLPMVSPDITSEEFVLKASVINGHHMAKAAVETALLDYELRAQKISLAHHLGVTRSQVPTGVSVGIHRSLDDLIDVVGAYLDEGYQRIKIKIDKGYDIEPVRALRQTFGSDMLLQVDANSAYSLDDATHLQQLDEFGLILIEQPFAEGDLASHIALSRVLRTPVCLDESITSFQVARSAIEVGACSVINVKPGRVGGLIEAKKIHDYCYEHNVPVWCGGMFETGIGRAVNVAFAALPGCLLVGDISPTHRYFHDDITESFEMQDGYIDVPQGPGIGVSPVPASLDAFATSRDIFQIR